LVSTITTGGAQLLSVTRLVLGGGAIGLYAGIGALTTLQDSGFYNMQNCTGVNDGALLCAFLVAGIPAAAIDALVLLPSNYSRPLDYPTVGANIVNNGSVFYTSDEGVELVQLAMTISTLNPNSTFAELYAATRRYLCVLVYNENLRQVEYMNKDTTPNVIVAYAVAASLAETFLYNHVGLTVNYTGVPTAYNYSTAAVRNNYPINVYSGALSSTIGINYVFDYDTVNWSYNDSAQANLIIGMSNLYQYLMNPSLNIPETPTEFTLNIVMPAGIIQYSHLLTEETKTELILQGSNNMCTYLQGRYTLPPPLCVVT